MNKTAALIFILFLFASCDPERCVSHYIENKTDNKIRVDFVIDNSNGLGSYDINSGEKQLLGSISCNKIIARIAFEVYDSIIISINDIPKIVYKENKAGKNIYNYDYWIINKNGKYDYEYIFEITEQDIPDSGN